MIPYNNLSKELKQKIINTYYENKSLSFKSIANLLGISKRSVGRVLRENNINTLLKNRYVIENKNYFSVIDSEFKAYVLGFIYADGFVGDNNDFVLALSDKCEDNLRLLNRIKSEIGISVDIRHIKDKYGNYTLKFVCPQIIKDLNKWGVFTRKSLTMSEIPILEDKYYSHFIRGYFDGDGTICSYLDIFDNRVRYLFEILGTESFLLKIQKILITNCNLKQTNLHKTHSEGITRISYKGIKSLIKIREYLYKDATIYINYKHDRFYNIK